MKSLEELVQQAEYFVDALSDYQCDLALFPEFFNAPLMGLGEHETSKDAIRALAAFSPEVVESMSKLAVSYNINIIAGSMPVIEDGELYNISYLCHRNGTVESQMKIHPTPHETRSWIMKGGNALRVFETDFGRIGILICYDVEFPELARMLADEDMQILFCAVLDRHQKRIFAGSLLRPGACYRKRVLCGDRWKRRQSAKSRLGRYSVRPVGCFLALRFCLSARRYYGREYAQHGDDTDCRSGL